VSLLACTLGRPSSSFPISAQCRAALPGLEIYSDTLAYNVLAKLHHYPASEWAWLEAIAPVLKASRGEFQDPRFADTGRRSLSLAAQTYTGSLTTRSTWAISPGSKLASPISLNLSRQPTGARPPIRNARNQLNLDAHGRSDEGRRNRQRRSGASLRPLLRDPCIKSYRLTRMMPSAASCRLHEITRRPKTSEEPARVIPSWIPVPAQPRWWALRKRASAF
jgi:hypothetical protein